MPSGSTAGGEPVPVPSGSTCLKGSGNFAANGPYRVKKRDVTIGSQGQYTIFSPDPLEASCKHPIVAWGNGTAVTGSDTYGFYNEHAASYGIVVIASHNDNVGSGEFHKAGLDYLLKENLTQGSEFFGKLSEVLLQRVDRVSMLHSLEARSPFLDHELVELAFSVPGSMKYQPGHLKALLKEVARPYLPAPILDRKKMGFSFPFKQWLRDSSLGGVVGEALDRGRIFTDEWLSGPFAHRLLREHRAGLADHAPRLWALYSLSRWYDRWVS